MSYLEKYSDLADTLQQLSDEYGIEILVGALLELRKELESPSDTSTPSQT